MLRINLLFAGTVAIFIQVKGQKLSPCRGKECNYGNQNYIIQLSESNINDDQYISTFEHNSNEHYVKSDTKVINLYPLEPNERNHDEQAPLSVEPSDINNNYYGGSIFLFDPSVIKNNERRMFDLNLFQKDNDNKDKKPNPFPFDPFSNDKDATDGHQTFPFNPYTNDNNKNENHVIPFDPTNENGSKNFIPRFNPFANSNGNDGAQPAFPFNPFANTNNNGSGQHIIPFIPADSDNDSKNSEHSIFPFNPFANDKNDNDKQATFPFDPFANKGKTDNERNSFHFNPFEGNGGDGQKMFPFDPFIPSGSQQKPTHINSNMGEVFFIVVVALVIVTLVVLAVLVRQKDSHSPIVLNIDLSARRENFGDGSNDIYSEAYRRNALFDIQSKRFQLGSMDTLWNGMFPGVFSQRKNQGRFQSHNENATLFGVSRDDSASEVSSSGRSNGNARDLDNIELV